MNFSAYIIPVIIIFLMIYAYYKKINAYESFIKGAKEGLKYSFEILPYVASMIIATSVFRSSLFVETITKHLTLARLINPDILTFMIFKPISGMASLAVLKEIYQNYGPDSFLGLYASVIQGSSDTTLYIITVYFGAIGIKEIKYAIKAGLLNDIINFILGFLILWLFLLR